MAHVYCDDDSQSIYCAALMAAVETGVAAGIYFYLFFIHLFDLIQIGI